MRENLLWTIVNFQSFYEAQKHKAEDLSMTITDRSICQGFYDETGVMLGVKTIRRWKKIPAKEILQKQLKQFGHPPLEGE